MLKATVNMRKSARKASYAAVIGSGSSGGSAPPRQRQMSRTRAAGRPCCGRGAQARPVQAGLAPCHSRSATSTWPPRPMCWPQGRLLEMLEMLMQSLQVLLQCHPLLLLRQNPTLAPLAARPAR